MGLGFSQIKELEYFGVVPKSYRPEGQPESTTGSPDVVCDLHT